MLGCSLFPVEVASEGLSEFPTKHLYNPGGDCCWVGGLPKEYHDRAHVTLYVPGSELLIFGDGHSTLYRESLS